MPRGKYKRKNVGAVKAAEVYEEKPVTFCVSLKQERRVAVYVSARDAVEAIELAQSFAHANKKITKTIAMPGVCVSQSTMRVQSASVLDKYAMDDDSPYAIGFQNPVARIYTGRSSGKENSPFTDQMRRDYKIAPVKRAK